ncbi:PaaI family thioesterase [Vannielia litorea]|uniref:PaaI family thioesterase n=1 Tax=Vannielia litorea TaxID=1217970 RepID=UPI001C97FB57|nr:PaaI family thioesterase [Vannielia litorea]MBY6152650.1 PaaI family thioesterase [Vannielia litorea]
MFDQVVMDKGALERFIESEFSQVQGDFSVEEITPDGVLVRLLTQDKHLRPGGTVSGPSMFGLVDVGMYFAVLSRIGPVALTVTTNCSIDFMRKPEAGRDLICTARLLKLGRTLAVGECHLRSEGREEVVARASLTYAIPPKRPE